MHIYLRNIYAAFNKGQKEQQQNEERNLENIIHMYVCM